MIPAFNAVNTICRAVESILSQSRQVLEIVVVDDASDEPLDNVLRTFGPIVRLIRQERGGASVARNRGIAAATGNVIAFLDADDEWMPSKIERCLEVLELHPEVDLVATRYVLQDPAEGTVRNAGPQPESCGQVIDVDPKTALSTATSVSTCTVVVRSRSLDDEQFDPTLKTAEDRDLWYRLLVNCRAWFLNDPLTNVHVSPHSLSHTDIAADHGFMLDVINRYSADLGRVTTARERALIHYKWATASTDHRQSISHAVRALLIFPAPFPKSRCRHRAARIRVVSSRCLKWVDQEVVRPLLSVLSIGQQPETSATTA